MVVSTVMASGPPKQTGRGPNSEPADSRTVEAYSEPSTTAAQCDLDRRVVITVAATA
jgi:hypothetical protein